MGQHTPEPWRAVHVDAATAAFRDGETWAVQAADGTWVAGLTPHQPEGCTEEANAHMLAAGPSAVALARQIVSDNADWVDAEDWEDSPDKGDAAEILAGYVEDARALIASTEAPFPSASSSTPTLADAASSTTRGGGADPGAAAR